MQNEEITHSHPKFAINLKNPPGFKFLNGGGGRAEKKCVW
jgi:hypothetical protein